MSCDCYEPPQVSEHLGVINDPYYQGLIYLKLKNDPEKAITEFAKIPNDWRALMRLYEIKKELPYIVESVISYFTNKSTLPICIAHHLIVNLPVQINKVPITIPKALIITEGLRSKYPIASIIQFLEAIGVKMAIVTEEKINSIETELFTLKELIHAHLNCRPGGPEALAAAADFKALNGSSHIPTPDAEVPE